MQSYSALTWDHPRGYDALAAATILRKNIDDIAVTWAKQPLEGFEAHPIADLCARYDIVIMDHPHVGEALDARCLQPLESVFDQSTLSEIAANSIGATFESYRFAGKHWALPLDAATQVLASRPDLMQQPVPTSWSEVARLSRETGRVAMSLAGPHTICTFMSMAAAFDDPPAVADPDVFVASNTGAEVYDLLSELASRSPAFASEMNPIAMLGYMTRENGILFCPLIFAYVTYANPKKGHRIAFDNAPRRSPGGKAGSTLGGTGIGLTARCPITPQLKQHLLWLMGRDAQVDFLPRHNGQPSHRAAWHDASVNRFWNDFYHNTAATQEEAYVRPRYNGYIRFQAEASAFLRQAMADRMPGTKAAAGLNELHRRLRGATGGER